MNIMKISRIICISCIVLMVMVSSIGISFAATSSELQQQKDIDSQIAETNSEIAGLKSKMSKELSKITKLNAEISTYENEIDDLQAKIANLDTQIVEKQNNIKEQEQKYVEQKELLDKRLVALYESGSTSYLDMLLSAEGLADFISKYYMIEQLAQCDQDLLTKIADTKTQIENEKASLESAKTEIQTSKTLVEGKRNSLKSSVSEKESIVSGLSAEEATLEEQLEEFEKDKKEIQIELAKIAAQNNVKPVAPSAAGYICPIPGKTKSNITYGYYAYPGHTGVDFSCGAGTSIVAVKSGTVVTSTAMKRPNGKYKSYGEYVVINHGDGTMTLYAHMLPNSRAVSVGQHVSQGQLIGKVGSTGNSTGPHLHFEVRIGGRHTNPTPYLP